MELYAWDMKFGPEAGWSSISNSVRAAAESRPEP
jgi:hypothetical protein